MTGFQSILNAAKEFEIENTLEAIFECKMDLKEIQKVLSLVRMYQQRLNLESLDLVDFSENFIYEYATDHNECFRLTEKLIRRIGTTITGSMKIFRKFCPTSRKRDNSGNIVPALDFTRLTRRRYFGQIFGVDPYIEPVKTLVTELNTFFYNLVMVLALCKEMIRKEEAVRGNTQLLKEIFEKSCDEVLHSVYHVRNCFGPVALVSEEELAQRRKNARPMNEWLAKEYHAHDRNWLMRESYIRRVISGSKYNLDEKASFLWASNPEKGQTVCELIPKLDSLGIPSKNSKLAKEKGKKGTFDAREMVYLIKWCAVSKVDDKGKVIDEMLEKKLYQYIAEKYTGDYMFPTWQAVCRERKFLYSNNVSMQEMADCFAQYLNKHTEAA